MSIRLGAVFYQMLTGQPAVRGGTTTRRFAWFLETEPGSPRMVNPKVDRDLSHRLPEMLEKDQKSDTKRPPRWPNEMLSDGERHEHRSVRDTSAFSARGKNGFGAIQPRPLLAGSLIALLPGHRRNEFGKSRLCAHPLPVTGIAVLPFEKFKRR